LQLGLAGKCLWLIKYLNVFAALAATYLHFGATGCCSTVRPSFFFLAKAKGKALAKGKAEERGKSRVVELKLRRDACY